MCSGSVQSHKLPPTECSTHRGNTWMITGLGTSSQAVKQESGFDERGCPVGTGPSGRRPGCARAAGLGTQKPTPSRFLGNRSQRRPSAISPKHHDIRSRRF